MALTKSRRRRSKFKGTAEELAAGLPDDLGNPNGCLKWLDLEHHQKAVADYLRSTGLSSANAVGLAPAVSSASGVAVCVLLKARQ